MIFFQFQKVISKRTAARSIDDLLNAIADIVGLFTSNSVSRLNHVECLLAQPAKKQLWRGICCSTHGLAQAIQNYIDPAHGDPKAIQITCSNSILEGTWNQDISLCLDR